MWLHGAVTQGGYGGLDTTALRGPRRGVQRARSRLRSLPVWIGAAVLAVVVVVVVAVAASRGTGGAQALADPVLLGALGIGVALAALVALLLAALVRSGVRRAERLAAFAADNGLGYHPRRPRTDDLPATALFDRVRRGGQEAWISDVVLDTRARRVEYGQAAVRRRNARGVSLEWWGYVAVRTTVALPHVAVLRRGRPGRATASFALLRQLAQQLPPRPAADPRFTLLCPPGYEQDVAAIVSPELLDRWAAMGLDVEILDQWVVLFRRGRVATLEPARWQELASMTAALDARLTAWERHRTSRETPQPS